jgi:hypothetical protein
MLQLGLQQVVTGCVELGREAPVRPDRGGQFPQHIGHPAAHVRIGQRVVLVGQPGAVHERPGEDGERDHRVLQGFQALAQG